MIMMMMINDDDDKAGDEERDFDCCDASYVLKGKENQEIRLWYPSICRRFSSVFSHVCSWDRLYTWPRSPTTWSGLGGCL
jgi:hypothetical protein